MMFLSLDGLDTLVIANWAKLSCLRLEAPSLLLAVIIVLITSCLITPPCYELSMKERGEKYMGSDKVSQGEKREGVSNVYCRSQS